MEKKSKLLELPGELRNRIYRYTLLNNDEAVVEIDHNGIPEPALLLTCKKTRREGGEICYMENTFQLLVLNYDSRTVMRWASKMRVIRTNFETTLQPFSITTHGQPNWQNLRLWLQRYHSQRINWALTMFQSELDEMSSWTRVELRVIAAMFHMVEAAREVPWDRLALEIEEHHQILVEVDIQWK